MENTNVLSTVVSAKGDAVRDFLSLTVDYQEKQFAQGVIPTSFTRREGPPKERELLCGRIIDRPIRPLFPPGFYHEVQVTASVLSSDGEHDPDVLAANATSAALMLSDIPWGGPIGMVRIGRICGKFIVNPTTEELKLSDLNLVYAGTMDKTLMIDVQACEISEKDLEAGLRMAHLEAIKYIEPQIRIAAKAGKSKKEYKLSMLSDTTMDKVRDIAEEPIKAVFTDPTYGKFERGEALDNITQDVKGVLVEEGDEESLKVLSKAVDTVRKKVWSMAIRTLLTAKNLQLLLSPRAFVTLSPLDVAANYLRNFRISGSYICSEIFLGVLIISAPVIAHTMDVGDALVHGDELQDLAEEEENEPYLWRLVFKFWLLMFFFIKVFTNLGDSIILFCIRLALFFLGTKPNPLSVYEVVEQLCQEDRSLKLKSLYANKVEVQDYKLFSWLRLK